MTQNDMDSFLTWKDFIYNLIVDYCNERGNRTFTLQEFQEANFQRITDFRPLAATPFNTLRRVLQELRDDSLISFLDNTGTYTLRGVEMLKGEIEDENLVEIKVGSPEKKEYLIETYVRNIGWANEAKEKFGLYCMCHRCANTFVKDDGIPYIEVHHIIPLCKGGEDGIWNLAVLCAHHHRMAHYAELNTRKQMEQDLLKEVQCRLHH